MLFSRVRNAHEMVLDELTRDSQAFRTFNETGTNSRPRPFRSWEFCFIGLLARQVRSFLYNVEGSIPCGGTAACTLQSR